jgi:integrase
MPKAKERDGVYWRADRRGWWASYIDAEGIHQRKKIKDAHTRTQALRALHETETKVEKEKRLGVREDSEITTEELMERFKKHQKSRLAPTTFARLDGILKTLQEHLPAQAKAITRAKVNEYVDTRALTVKPGTVAKELFTLSKILRLATDEWGLLNRNAAHGVKPPKQPEGRTKYLTPGELKAALESAPEWMRAPMAFAACTGCRRGELLGLKWMDVEREKRLLYLRETKNGTTRILRLSDAALQVLASLPRGRAGDAVFAGVDGQKLSVYSRRVFHRLGIPDASFHTLRHTMASWRVMEGEDLYTVSKILGHKTLRMTERYAHLSPEYMAKAAGTLDGIMGKVLGPPGKAIRMLGAGTAPVLKTASKPASVSHHRVTRKRHA